MGVGAGPFVSCVCKNEILPGKSYGTAAGCIGVGFLELPSRKKG